MEFIVPDSQDTEEQVEENVNVESVEISRFRGGGSGKILWGGIGLYRGGLQISVGAEPITYPTHILDFIQITRRYFDSF